MCHWQCVEFIYSRPNSAGFQHACVVAHAKRLMLPHELLHRQLAADEGRFQRFTFKLILRRGIRELLG